MANELLKELAHRALVGFGQAGARAIAAGAKSVAIDGKKLTREADRRIGELVKNLDRFTGFYAEEDEEDDGIEVK